MSTIEVRKEQAAARLREAARTGVTCEPVRDLLEGMDVKDAYEVQLMNIGLDEKAGAAVIGWKAGLTARSVQQQLGADSPDFGALLNTCGYGDSEPVPLTRLLQPKIEAEVAFVLERDLPERRVTAADILRSTAFVVPAFEIVASRITNWDITILDTVADNASSGLFTLGLKPVLLKDVDLGAVTMSMTFDGNEASCGQGHACMGNPVNAVVWLANTLCELGKPLRAGDLILSGPLGPMVSVTGPSRFEATIEGLGTVTTEFIDG
ncbi:MAG: 2-keto-4-pentenoate hydratase [Burkholderiales bacterium 21-58-4]|nr:MAG: 2-keto-4-pentenoate hydratase [Burkholderiales bacterium 21-58-4]